ncbi:hypothetical protein ACFPYI_21010 [Halomarina salina]|uniref:HTH domain-containing protein n=1 Tax=Halomarina salina TaxID=1872699 RepID=A0ABD5RTS1_9EURY|nr:hypothetical protein [Halomarina salina]
MTLTPDDVLNAIGELHRATGRPVTTASEVAAHLDASKRTVNDRLSTLAYAEKIGRFEAGGRSVVYWDPDVVAVISAETSTDDRTHEGTDESAYERTYESNGADERPHVRAHERTDESADDTPTAPRGEGSGVTAAPVDEPDGDSPGGDSDEQTVLDAVSFPSTRDREACVAAVLAVREYLREHGPTSRADLVDQVMPKHTVGYDVPDPERESRYRGGWWRSVVKPALEEYEDVEKPKGGGRWSLVDSESL